MKEAAILIVLLLSFSHLQMTWAASFLDPFGLFENEVIEQEILVPEEVLGTVKDTRTAEFNSSFLVVGKSIYRNIQSYFTRKIPKIQNTGKNRGNAAVLRCLNAIHCDLTSNFSNSQAVFAI